MNGVLVGVGHCWRKVWDQEEYWNKGGGWWWWMGVVGGGVIEVIVGGVREWIV